MTYQRAGWIAVIKRIAGWVIFIPALLSTVVSVLEFLYQMSQKQAGINAVMMDFLHVMIDMIKFNTSFLNVFWFNSPVPTLGQGWTVVKIAFFVIYWLIFVGLALQASGARMSRQVRHIREGLDDQMILENAKGEQGMSREQLEAKVQLPHHTIFLQFFPLYILPVIIAAAAYFALRLLGIL
ncbi:YniB family protein [Enterobacillus tribolii]|uniref:YniB-like protein n=1 Tax=Enterobacillus tribolii TaxID=1487935 RepID=A0A370R3K7_9GAMM|nr:YniB family protein [Enterobacillus tribolii]MBW7984062.1 hypothetical protein [Enterobacillus tribolii]RDK97003.1 YniB-like protein [Enterobacillus tribolii]